MKLLAVDAATEACSVALLVGDVIYERHMVSPRGHAQRLLTMVDEVMNEAGQRLKSLDAIAFDRGPGSFTGVRVGTSVTQGLAFGADLPVIPVSSLAIIAQGTWRETGQAQVLSVIDARMGEVYWGYYTLNEDVMVLTGSEHVCVADAITPAISGNWYGAGTGWQSYQSALQSVISAECNGINAEALPCAQDMLTLAKRHFIAKEYISADQALPTYLRNEVAKKQSRV